MKAGARKGLKNWVGPRKGLKKLNAGVWTRLKAGAREGLKKVKAGAERRGGRGMD